MAAKLERTGTPGVYKRGSRFLFSYRLDGRQKWESASTEKLARKAKEARLTDIGRGEFSERSRVTFHEYARDWVERYQGRGRRGFREHTRDEYRAILDRYVLSYFPPRTRLTDITPSQVAAFVAWLCKQTRPAPTKDDPERQVPLADKSVRNYTVPLRACLATAMREGLLRSNPARDIDLPHRPAHEDIETEDVKALTEDELRTLLALMPERWRLFFRVLGSTGLRVSEAIAVQWRHLHLDGSTPHLRVRRALVKGTMGAPKSRHSRRHVPLDPDLVLALRMWRRDSEWAGDDDLVFPVRNGSPIMPNNLRRRVLKPTAQEAGVPWVGFHSFRHTCASLLFAQGRNAVQVQRWLGHHSAAFTLARYVHLLDGDIGEPLALGVLTQVQTSPTPEGTVSDPSQALDLAA
jgi:integrase